MFCVNFTCRHSPSTSRVSGAVRVEFQLEKIEDDSKASTSNPTSTSQTTTQQTLPVSQFIVVWCEFFKLLFYQGVPDIAVVVDEEPHLFIALGEVKKAIFVLRICMHTYVHFTEQTQEEWLEGQRGKEPAGAASPLPCWCSSKKIKGCQKQPGGETATYTRAVYREPHSMYTHYKLSCCCL